MTPTDTGASASTPPLIAHVVFRFDVGGLENGIVNLVNRMPADRYRHAVVSLQETNPEFRRRVTRHDVAVVTLHKRPGKDLPAYHRMWRTLRDLRPAIVHTRNLGTMDMQWVAAAAGVRHRVHGEHGWSPSDPQGLDPTNLRLRRACRPVVHRYVAMSRDIAHWLECHVGVPAGQIRQLYSGVDSQLFCPDGALPLDMPWRRSSSPQASPAGHPSAAGNDLVVLGTVGRFDPIKNQAGLLDAFRRILERRPELRGRVRLVIVGDGPLNTELRSRARKLGLDDLVWFPGARADVPALMSAMDVFVLPSRNEGISNTILEAMASGLPVVACRVGGNPELVVDGLTGALCEADDPAALENALLAYLDEPARRRDHGLAARERAVRNFSLDTMVGRYLELYDELLFPSAASAAAGRTAAPVSRPGREGAR